MDTYNNLKTVVSEHTEIGTIACEERCPHAFSQSIFRAVLSLEILRRYSPLSYLDGVRLASIMTVDLSCFQGNGKTSRVQHWHGTYWQRTPTTIEVELLGWDVLRLTLWLVPNSSEFPFFYVESVCFISYFLTWVCLSGRTVLFYARVSWCGRDTLYSGDEDNKRCNRTVVLARG